MTQHFVSKITLVLGSIAAAIGGGIAQAQTPLEPRQHVYPDSTQQEIQQAIDNGGTVYFERFTKATHQYGEYNQIASSRPDVAPQTSAEVKNNGYFVGRNGKDVDIIGVLGPAGERPKMNGGTVPFRIGTMAGYGFFGLPVNFKIENLEIFNPDLTAPGGMYSRIAIWAINVIGKRSIVNNCKITITGKETDPSPLGNASAAVFILLFDNSSAALVPTSTRPTTGASIDITNNTIVAARIHNAIGVAGYWPSADTFTPPRVFISNNTIYVKSLVGHGEDLGAAINLGGDLSNSIVTSNVVQGDGRFPGADPAQVSTAIRIGRPRPGEMYSANLTIVGNDSSSFTGDYQVWMTDLASWSTVARNLLGPATIAGVWCQGHDNTFDRNHFYGAYPGWWPFGDGPGLIQFAKTSAGNRLGASALNFDGDMCGQLIDETDNLTTTEYDGANFLPGYRCSRN